MHEDEQLPEQFTDISIQEARVDSKLPDGVTLSFRLSPIPVPVPWKALFTNLSGDKRGSVMSTTNPLLHGDDIVWKVIEGDIPNAKRFVEDRVRQANALFVQRLADRAERRELALAVTPPAEIERLQHILDQA
jgi:hypothetical protein